MYLNDISFNYLARAQLLVNPRPILIHTPFRRRTRWQRPIRLVARILQQQSHHPVPGDVFRCKATDGSPIIRMGPQVLHDGELILNRR